MALKLITPPAKEPVTLSEQKEWMRISHSHEDQLIDSLVTAARHHCEVMLRRQLITATYRLTLEWFKCKEIYLPVPPTQSITSIVYLDDDGDATTLDTSDYLLQTDSEPAKVTAAYELDWPTARVQSDSVKITFVAGYGAEPSSVPQNIRLAIKLLAAHYYENREAASERQLHSLPQGVENLLQSASWGNYFSANV